MLGTLIKKEITETILDLRFVIVTLLCVVLIPLGMYVSRRDYERRLAAYQSEHQAYRQRHSQAERWDVQIQGLRPPSVLSIFASGVDPLLPDKVLTSYSGLFLAQKEAGTDNPHSLFFGKADFLFSMAFVMSLVALILTFDSITGEKASGTLALMLATSVPRIHILLGKILGSYIVLLIPFVISVLIALMILGLSPDVPVASSEVWPAFLIILAVTGLFIFAMVSLGVCISTLTKHSMNSIVLAFFVWMMFSLGIPKLSPMVAQILHPIEAAAVLRLAKETIVEDIEKEFDQQRQRLLERCFEEQEAPVEDMTQSPPSTEEGKRARAKYEEQVVPLARQYKQRLAEDIRRIEQDYAGRRNRQYSAATDLSRISPISCYSYIVSALSDTGIHEPDNFARNAQRYQSQVEETIYDRYDVRVGNTGVGGGPDRFNIYHLPPVPDMVYTRCSLAEVLGTSWPDALLLVLFNVLFYALAFWGLNRYDVR
jgi:ABC-type transport system involved in multi-copper enzyme maturation permease subunit